MKKNSWYLVNGMKLEYMGKEKEDCNCAMCGRELKQGHIFESDNYGMIVMGSECIKKVEIEDITKAMKIPQLKIQLSNNEIRTLKELKKEIVYCIEWLEMEISDHVEDESKYIKACRKQIEQCEKLLNEIE